MVIQVIRMKVSITMITMTMESLMNDMTTRLTGITMVMLVESRGEDLAYITLCFVISGNVALENISTFR